MNEKGFTLIELCLGLIILGLLIGPAIREYRLWTAKKEITETLSSLASVKKAAIDFYFENDRFPCPADPTLTVSDSTYGDENCSGTDPVIVGSVPFKLLKLPESVTLDGWSNRLTYAVTRTQTTAPLNPSGGSIIVQGYDFAGNIGNFSSKAQFVVVSHGNRGIGGYSANGALIQACPTGAAATTEAENCDGDEAFFTSRNARSAVDDLNYYDDYIEFQGFIPTRTWTYSKTADENMFTSSTMIGIGESNPNVQLDVSTTLHSVKVNAMEMCDVDGNNCFESVILGGPDGIGCGSNVGPDALTGIAEAHAKCPGGFGLATGSCPAGQFMSGIDAGGNVICGSP